MSERGLVAAPSGDRSGGKSVARVEERGLPKLFYGVNSEGMGHAMRSLPVIERLRKQFDVHVFCGGRVRQYLETRLPNVWDLFFVPLIYRDNRMMVGESFRAAFARAPTCFKDAGWLYLKMRRDRPVAVVTDYEFLTTWIGFFTGQRIVCVDNNHLALWGAIPPPTTPEAKADKETVVAASKWSVPFADVTLLTSFWQPGLLPGTDTDKVRFAPCAVRDEVLLRRDAVRDDGAVVVYQTSSTNRRLPAVLHEAVANSALSFKVYGSGQEPHDDAGGRIRFCAFSGDAFLDDLAACPFVVVNGGHSTIVEALALGKAIVAEPVVGQYEQVINAMGLEATGTGIHVPLLEASHLVSFAAEAAACRERARALHVVDTDALVAQLTKVIGARTLSEGLSRGHSP